MSAPERAPDRAEAAAARAIDASRICVEDVRAALKEAEETRGAG